MASEIQTSSLPPAQPTYIFRGHAAQIHSVRLVRRNTRIVTGDAEGWIVVWKIESKRPTAVWRAHAGPVLGTAEWGSENILTHGRDNSLKVWQLQPVQEEQLSSILPAEGPNVHRSQPWLLHSMPVNTLNFCSFSSCPEFSDLKTNHQPLSNPGNAQHEAGNSILVAVPATDDKKVEVYQLPSERLVYMVPRVQPTDTGMVMALKIAHHSSGKLLVVAGYEGGFTAVHQLEPRNQEAATATVPGSAHTLYLSQPHTQPILSLDISHDFKTYFTSSADAVLAAHRIPEPIIEYGGPSSRSDSEQVSEHAFNSTEAPQQVPDQSAPLAESSSEPLSFSKREPKPAKASATPTSAANTPSLFSEAFVSAPKSKTTRSTPSLLRPEPAFKVAQTGHAGQQSLSVRSDGRILATAGWDSRVRIYSTKTLKELAVLKWHKEGVYAVAFGDLLESSDLMTGRQSHEMKESKAVDGHQDESQAVAGPAPPTATANAGGLTVFQKQREQKMQVKHWILAGAKDGKVSLWEIY